MSHCIHNLSGLLHFLLLFLQLSPETLGKINFPDLCAARTAWGQIPTFITLPFYFTIKYVQLDNESSGNPSIDFYFMILGKKKEEDN